MSCDNTTQEPWQEQHSLDNNSEGGVSLISVHLVALGELSAEHGMTHIPALLSLIAALWQRLD